MSKKEMIKRYILFIICLFFMGIGVALTKHGELGVSPISSVANAVSLEFTFFLIRHMADNFKLRSVAWSDFTFA